jgi:secreted PhoX family phosphatase
VTPWGSWLTCEEQIADIGGLPHGYVFEVPGQLPARPIPLTSMGRFAHEAVAVDGRTSIIYLTEVDRYVSGFYRFTPNVPFTTYGLEAGGTLEMLAVVGQPQADLQQAEFGQSFSVEWIEIEFPDTPRVTNVGPFGSFDGSRTNASGPFYEGWLKGAARFRRLEGCWYDGGSKIYFADTEGGRPAVDTGEPEGVIWCYDIDAETLTVIYESPAEAVLDNPDNVTVSPNGNLLLCEDGDLDGLRLAGLTLDGQVFPFAVNNVVLNGERNGLKGDFRGAEWAGATFDPTGKWLFVNNFAPGITFAITGPWARGAF